MKRITPEEVLAAYQKTGIRPYRNVDTNCALAALHGAARSNSSMTEYADRRWGKDYVNGFVKGFDGCWADQNLPTSQVQGFLDGSQVAENVFPNPA